MSLHPEELTITDTSGDNFAVQDIEGDTVLELPKHLVRNAEGADHLLNWLAPVLNQVEHNAIQFGKEQGREQMRRDLAQLLGLTPEGRTDRIDQRLVELEVATTHY